MNDIDPKQIKNLAGMASLHDYDHQRSESDFERSMTHYCTCGENRKFVVGVSGKTWADVVNKAFAWNAEHEASARPNIKGAIVPAEDVIGMVGTSVHTALRKGMDGRKASALHAAINDSDDAWGVALRIGLDWLTDAGYAFVKVTELP